MFGKVVTIRRRTMLELAPWSFLIGFAPIALGLALRRTDAVWRITSAMPGPSAWPGEGVALLPVFEDACLHGGQGRNGARDLRRRTTYFRAGILRTIDQPS